MEKKRRGGQIIWVKENSILCLRENEKQSEILGELAENPSATATVAAVSATTKGNGVVPGTANANLRFPSMVWADYLYLFESVGWW